MVMLKRNKCLHIAKVFFLSKIVGGHTNDILNDCIFKTKFNFLLKNVQFA